MPRELAWGKANSGALLSIFLLEYRTALVFLSAEINSEGYPGSRNLRSSVSLFPGDNQKPPFRVWQQFGFDGQARALEGLLQTFTTK